MPPQQIIEHPESGTSEIPPYLKHMQVQRNVAHARELGYAVLDPDEGMLAAGEGSGPGRMPEPETILAHGQERVSERVAYEHGPFP